VPRDRERAEPLVSELLADAAGAPSVA
jgi:hypothetical protein